MRTHCWTCGIIYGARAPWLRSEEDSHGRRILLFQQAMYIRQRGTGTASSLRNLVQKETTAFYLLEQVTHIIQSGKNSYRRCLPTSFYCFVVVFYHCFSNLGFAFRRNRILCCTRDRCHFNFGISSINLMALEHRFLQLLELPTSAATSKIFLSQKIQDKLFPGGHIHGVVRPDLPEVHPFFKFVSARVATGEKKRPKLGTTMGTPSAASSLEIIGQMESSVQNASCWRVQTVAAQMRSRKDVCRHLLTSAQTVNASGYGGALLLVSGGHPLRRLPVVDRFLPSNSLDMLRTASQLRKFGNISPGTQ
ncbi:hypothetical protein MPTK1_1g09410 [Marchantia polymorpha subsp. ruderalis]|uniref:Uncharacterized protein n=2 Tax=Marchantia polymorpha TaxID=3197 RepID=A0AAF6AN94_MARPO|nr:hypothetical protein MARPO_0096s0059 [Marchantia polymorpha]BBM97914.1 hypothetical protein Mp_1g09410 [Marchantia polymorpha subsp. ruderalis]|eukprot:PTQ32715.1 hypothetical protein MARPO_0096s0059 [Marchantia polymorpha]